MLIGMNDADSTPEEIYKKWFANIAPEAIVS